MIAPIRAIYESGTLRLLDPVDLIEGEQVNVAVFKEQNAVGVESHAHLSARELMRLPLGERNRILEEQASRAEMHYCSDPAQTAFEAVDQHDIYDEAP